MDQISIIGIGVISRMGNDPELIWKNLMSDDYSAPFLQGAIPFESGLSRSQKVRSNRYSEMGIYASQMALSDANIDLESVDKKRVGTIFTTGYGPIVSSLDFTKSVVEGDSEFCSPTVFANSVNNACVGHICILLGLKGISTMLMGSNNLEYSHMQMKKGETDLILTGSIEEYCKDLRAALAINSCSKDVDFGEGAVTFLVSQSECYDSVYCHIVDFLTCNISGYPLADKLDKLIAIKRIKNITEKLTAQYKIDAFFSSCNGSYFDLIELNAAKSVLGKEITYVNNVKKLFGETIGSAFNFNVMVAALCLKHGALPIRLDSAQRQVKNILVSGYDISGNYTIAIIRKNDKGD